MFKPFRVFGRIGLGVLPASCGGLVAPGLPSAPQDAGVVFDLAPDAQTPPAYLEALPVAEGWVVEAYFYLDDETQSLEPEQKCDLVRELRSDRACKASFKLASGARLPPAVQPPPPTGSSASTS
jgi:hypothetical protein